MSPLPRDDPGNFVTGICNEVVAAWGLNTIFDALPGTLNTVRSKNVMEWGMDFILELQKLARITEGKHADVVKALQIRVGQRRTTTRPNAAPHTVIEDINHLLQVHAPRPVNIPPMEHRNNPRVGAHQAGAPQTPPRRSKRILQREKQQRANQADDEEAVDFSPRRATKRKRDLRDEGDAQVQGSDEPRKRANVRLRAPERQQNVEEDDLVERYPEQQAGGQLVAEGNADHQAGDQDNQLIQIRQEQQVEIRDEEDYHLAKYATFEEKYPLPAGASPAQRADLLRALKKRNRDLKAAGPHFRDSIDSEYDYRILLEETKDDYRAHGPEQEEFDEA